MSGHSGFMPIGGAGQAGVNFVNNIQAPEDIQLAQTGATPASRCC